MWSNADSPQSPRWLILKGRDEEAQKSLARLLSRGLGSEEVNAEFAEIAATIHAERGMGTTSYLDCFRNGPGRNGLRMWTGIGIQALQQLTGINFIFYYVRAPFDARRSKADETARARPSLPTRASATRSSSRSLRTS